MKNKKIPLLFLIPAWMLLGWWVGVVLAAPAPEGSTKATVEKIEKAILQASELQEQGKLQKGRPLVVPISPEIRLVFTAENFNADLNQAFKVLDQVMSRAKTEGPQLLTPAPPQAKGSPRSAPQDRLSALRDSEQQTTQAASGGKETPLAKDFSVYKNYRDNRQARAQEEGKVIEAEKQAVLAERQAAAQNQQRKRERDQQLQAQATAWQGELDKQAKASAGATLQWEQEHSFGAYVKRFLGVVVQTSVGAFTGGFLGTLSTNLANQAVGSLFPSAQPNVYTQGLAAGTSAAITQTGTTVGQTVGQQAAATVSGSGSAATSTPSTTATATNALQYTVPKF
jgi:hypothetical protein